MDRTLISAAALLRQARPEDADCISEFVCGLSPEARYLRFFASVAPPSSGLLRVLSGGTGADCLLVTDGAGAVIAHGMAADTAVSGGLASNIGLVVTDRWQQQGLGRLLLSTLVGRAARRGVRSLVLDVLPDNHRMLGMLDRRWPGAPRERTRDATIVRPAITPWQAAGGGPVPAILRLPASPSATSPSGGARAPGRSAA
jgi:ribosomal protein S18 acetylase RimI-like enzyme